ncbi:MAG: helix-turn-helix transcriptional regulator [Candidatus Heimdallarchaeota archaeon]|nr:helix-turn-helix transcriptional regulator [Candidatus Heimdallarchaeota archaeon]
MSEREITDHQVKRLEEISSFIKNWRLNVGLTQREFSELAGVHPNSLYRIENMRIFNILTLLKCIDATELTVAQFFEGIE